MSLVCLESRENRWKKSLYYTNVSFAFAGLFFVRFKENSILTKNAETRILLQNSILFLTKLIFPAFLSKFVELKLVFVWLEAIPSQTFG